MPGVPLVGDVGLSAVGHLRPPVDLGPAIGADLGSPVAVVVTRHRRT